MAVAIIFMGLASPLFTRRMEVSTNNLLHQMERVQTAQRPVTPESAAKRAAIPLRARKNESLATISLRHVQP
jgi:hypothetical protein